MKEILIRGYGLSSICRLCLSNATTLLDIFAFSSRKRNRLVKVIMKCAPVKVMRDDEMPNFICNLCYTKLEDIHQFQMKIVQSEKTLRRCLQKLHASDKQITPGYSIQRTSEDPLRLACNTIPDLSLKNEFPQLHDVIWKEKEPSNVQSDYTIDEEMCIKSEIKDESMDVIDDNSFILPECDDDIAETFLKDDASEISSEDFKIDIEDTKMKLASWKDNRPANKAKKVNKRDDDSEIVVKRTKTSKTKKYQCDVCNMSFTRFSDFAQHKRTHGEKPYHCDLCEKTYAKLSLLKIHKRIHTGEKPYKCDVCTKCYHRLDNLIAHKRRHVGEKPYKCDLCNNSYTHRSNLYYHKRTHSGEKPHQCDVCNKRFIVFSDMEIHKRIHTGEKPYQCDICGKRFTYLGNLNSHTLTHTGEKRYQCDVCKKCFSQSSSLNTHKLIHASEKSYQCDVCNKSFKHSYYLKIHKRTHSGEKPYKCDICNKCFAQSGSLNSHKLAHSWEY